MTRHILLASVLCSLALVGCRDAVSVNGDGGTGLDEDGDGFTSPDDCDDSDPSVYPGAHEACNGVDDDCDGTVDDDAYDVWYDDGDEDGFGDPGDTTESCDQPSGTVANGDDCNDGRSDINPDGIEKCDGVDNDCDGEVDEGDAVDAPTWHADADGDGYGDSSTGITGCDQPAGTVEDGTDCDDDNPDVHPGVRDTWYDGVDSDCAGDDDYDRDGDGYSSDSYGGDDCNDADYDVNPGALDTWYDGEDTDCAGNSDYDADGDEFDSDAYGGTDCDDRNAAVYPGADEVDAGVDNDCDGEKEQMPVAVAAYDSSSELETCLLLQLDGSGSYDPDGTALSYAWELTSAPSTSARTTSDIDRATDEKPDFFPDVAGDYTFTLSVTDAGDATSTPNSVSATIAERTTNNKPVANAGSDSTETDTVTCTPLSYGVSYSCAVCDDTRVALRGTGSKDADGEPLTYAWTVLSGTATIDDDTARSTTATVSYTADVTYGSTSSEEVVLQLEVTDCFGDSSTDTVTVTLECTGS